LTKLFNHENGVRSKALARLTPIEASTYQNIFLIYGLNHKNRSMIFKILTVIQP